MLSFLRRKWITVIKPLRGQHAGDCARIHAASFAHSWNSIDLESMITSRDHRCDGAFNERDDRLLAFSIVREVADEAEILTIATDEQARRCGIAALLLAFQMTGLRDSGVKVVFLEVDESNLAGLRLYARLGFRQVGQRPAYYTQGFAKPANALIMSVNL